MPYRAMPSFTTPRRRTLATAALLASGLALAGCASADPSPAPSSTSSPATSVLSEHGLDGLDARAVVDRLDTMAVADRPADLMASVRPDVLILTDDHDRETRLPMPDAQVYVSVAPYRNDTHDCYFHSLTTCRGEMANEDVQVVLTSTDGTVVLDETRTTYDNGFMGFWLPRDFSGELVVSQDGVSGSAKISTTSVEDPTCVTTMQLT